MEGLLNRLLENSSLPIVTALILGLMTTISPCTLATNITAIGFIGKNLENRNRVFYNGLIYTLGRVIAYTLLAFIIFLGADQFTLSGVFQRYGEKIIGPLLFIIGLFMLDILKIKFPGLSKLSQRFEKKDTKNYWDVLLLGILFALAFCPYSGVLYFGILIPMTIGSASGLYLPVVFAIATGIPVIIFAWLIAYTVSGVGTVYNRIKVFEIWFRRMISVLFIGVGIYYIVTVFF
ncbi:sulfite exporter TauE/SafE family protein [Mariniphaga sediminis]|jgi:sulfite exporter TauE/SafE|uniref:Sulfite exporter TauE/SafE family protein n=1 Tax=Mariniphaga sediminis TaxID=1628158 RepID=A0A399CZL9_9BACT|nr:aromatic aminobenezylarsenical efflux permease ArsG family transporter [Mariniphaga sediminis]MBD3623004.1 sulfite exporter TauE/SafE family protein [Sunxiuqinia sp.]RIH64378.1 sulfite exporter TauE/SafE family protein [Mariniphaga sediminis]